ncbi:MAG: autotransporter-associated beta strand repeat-containing protein, partial [Verrucomicrobia bacterium]|nr:autotransporter-associated beta strand repeat-containing protein [Verrucomicrobiota bacterium]
NAGFELNQLNLGATVTLAGNSLAFVANGATLPTINQNSGSTVTISNDLDLGSNATFGGSGNGQVNLSGSLTGAGSLTKNSSGGLTLNGDFSTYSGGTTINAGSLSLGKTANALLGTGPVIVNSPATLHLNGNGNLTNEFTLNGATVTNGNSFSANLNGPVTLETTTTFDLATTGNMSIGGIVSGTGGLTKLGTAGPLILSGLNTYTGPTTVAAGTLRCDLPAALGSGDLSINTGGAKVNLNYTGTKNIAALTLGGVAQTAPGTYGSIASGADFQDDTYFVGSGTVTLGGLSGFAGWANTNAPGQTPAQDYDNDGVENGLEYFMGQSGSSFTAMPGLDATNMVSWPADTDYLGTYEVQTSPDLATWTNVDPRPVPSGGTLSYTLPPGAPGGKSFVRLLVTPTP